MEARMETAIFGGGCFWCTEAVFNCLRGVVEIEPGYCGGQSASPTYEEVCSGESGHIEVIQIQFDSNVISYDTLLDVFFATHDPTTPNRQGHDVGTQYQSVIFAQNDEQQQKALHKIEALNRSGEYEEPIVTKVLQAEAFWVAEKIHHEYYANYPGQGYCQIVIKPKINKTMLNFKELLK